LEWRTPARLDGRLGHHLEHTMGQPHSERVDACTPVVGERQRPRVRDHADAVRDQPLELVGDGARAQLVVRLAHRRVVAEARAIADVEPHRNISRNASRNAGSSARSSVTCSSPADVWWKNRSAIALWTSRRSDSSDTAVAPSPTASTSSTEPKSTR